MTTEERMQALEANFQNHEERLNRHSKRLEKLETSYQDVSEMREEMKEMKKSIKKMESHQISTDRKLIAYNKWTIGLLLAIFGLIVYIAVKSPETAKDVVAIAGGALTKVPTP